MATLSNVTIKQGTTPIFTAIVDGPMIQDATVYVTIRARNWMVVKSNYHETGDVILEPIFDEDEVTQIGTSVSVKLTQPETLCLRPCAARVEVGWVFEDGSSDKSNIGIINITPTLYRKVMEYGKHSS